MPRKPPRQPSRPNQPEIEARDLLSSSRRPDARQLVDAIHAINPTGQDLPAAVAERRYALKASLQSLLIRHYSTDLAIEPDPDAHGVVSLRHRYVGGDACHAAIDALDDDARSWLQLQLDTDAWRDDDAPVRTSTGTTPFSRTTREGAPSALASARNALADYDYDAAQAAFRLALQESTGLVRIEAARGLMELLVETLGTDAEAIATLESLDDRTRADPRVASFEALALAREGRVESAVARMAHCEPRGVPDVLAALCTRAVRDERLDDAVKHARELRERAPGHAILATIEQAVAELAARARAPREKELRDAEGRDPERAERIAREILDRWPESEIARRVVREAANRRRVEERAAWTARVDELIVAGEWSRAAEACVRARQAGADTADREARIEIGAEHSRRTREAALRERAIDRVRAAGGRTEALRAYLENPPEVRAVIRERIDDGSFDDAEAIAEHARGDEVIRVVGRIDEAERCLAAGDPERALRSLSENALTMRAPRARRVRAEAERRGAEIRNEEAHGALSRARELAAGPDAEAAWQAADTVDPKRLDDAAIRELESIRESLRPRIRRVRLERSLAEFERAERWLEARDVARSLGEDGSPASIRWHERAREYDVKARAAFEVFVDDDPCEPAENAEVAAEVRLVEGDPLWAADDEGIVTFFECVGRHIAMRTVDVESGRVRRRLSFRTPEPMERPVPIEAGRVTRCVDRRGRHFAFDRETGDVVAWGRWRFLPEGAWSGTIHPLLGARFVQLDAGNGDQVVDFAHGRVVRTLGRNLASIAVTGSAGAEYLVFDRGRGTYELCNAATDTRVPIRPPADTVVLRAIAGPREGLLIGLVVPATPAHRPAPGHLMACVLGAGAAGPPVVVSRNWDHGPLLSASSTDDGLVYFGVPRCGSGGTLAAFEVTDDHRFVERWRTACSKEIAFAIHGASRKVFAFRPQLNDLRVERLGARPPSAIVTDAAEIAFARFPVDAFCHVRARSIVATRQPPEALVLAVGAGVDWRLERLAEMHSGTADMLVELAHDAVRIIQKTTRVFSPLRPILEVAEKKHPGDPRLTLLRACFEAWNPITGSDSVAVAMPEFALPEETAHWFHLKGVAHFRRGEYEAAGREWLAGSVIPGDPCGLREYLGILPESAGGDPSTATGALRALCVQADALFKKADARRDIVTLLETPLVFHAAELQSVARLAGAWIGIEPQTTRERWRRRRALMWLSALADMEDARSLPFVGASMKRAEIDELVGLVRGVLGDVSLTG